MTYPRAHEASGRASSTRAEREQRTSSERAEADKRPSRDRAATEQRPSRDRATNIYPEFCAEPYAVAVRSAVGVAVNAYYIHLVTLSHTHTGAHTGTLSQARSFAVCVCACLAHWIARSCLRSFLCCHKRSVSASETTSVCQGAEESGRERQRE